MSRNRIPIGQKEDTMLALHPGSNSKTVKESAPSGIRVDEDE